MKDLLAKLLGMFHKPEPTKPVESWPFPPVSEDFESRKECCGGCDKPAKKTVKKATTRKPAVKKPVAKKPATKKAK